MLDLPPLVPSRETAEAAAEALWKSVNTKHGCTWDEEAAHVRNYYTQRAIDMLAATGPRLVIDVLRHLVDNRAAYAPYGGPGIITPDLRSAADDLHLALIGL